ncbi:D-Ala-D-Ala carboxypeptidase family metallohydrolase [Nocardioides sp. Root151]|uniref:D-Ala-D-Ala carboxypeptidase family metallohydrolase n=1 Tax=Nocardioides sp. Root151 TaxID=1736475 RepID=UPI00070385D0|nr:D-Ala-D-Ala carboxypeptidase family metallohydrolase [Nocardioides sp. Root151]KQZ67317.1 peptidase M15 [Nocardioides sp. Root151]
MPIRMSSLVAALVLALSSLVLLGSAPASADACYTWSRTLRSGTTGSDVAKLQERVAGWAGYGVNMAIDGSYGPQTTQAVRNFQAAYGLSPDGVAGPATQSKIYALQDADCSPLHFAWSEVDGGCGAGGYSGGSVSATTVKTNLLRSMWRAEALRHRMGDNPIRVTSGFRSQACDRQVGGSGTGQHTYGRALDLVPENGNSTFCRIAQNARYIGYGTIFGPGYPDHNDHVHVDIRSGRTWSAPNCGI